LAGVKRVIFASSGAAVTGYENDFPYSALVKGEYDKVPSSWPMLTAESPVRPNNLYGASKVWGEALGRYYSEAFNMSVICLRFGRVKMEDKPTTPRDFTVWCSLRDAAQMLDRCIVAPEDLRFDILYVVSNNRWRHRDIEHARKVVGYSPQDGAGSYG
jgi:nucleoside-diphosphate-sugar epimerase